VLIGAPPPRRGLARLWHGESLLSRLLEGLPGVDVRIVADPSLRRPATGDRAAAESDEALKDLLKAGGVGAESGEARDQSA
jgi:hypothetical protein